VKEIASSCSVRNDGDGGGARDEEKSGFLAALPSRLMASGMTILRKWQDAALKGGATWRLPEVAPVVEFVGVFDPAVADVGAVVHVGDHYVFYAGVDLGLGLQHGLAGADDD
jgi:hypothetical protein